MLNKERFDKGLWWNKAWSLVDGCTPVSEACDHCWLASIDYRFSKGHASAIDGRAYFHGGIVARIDRLTQTLKTKKPTIWAVWSDLFHEHITFEYVLKAFAQMQKCNKHIYLVLTKRPDRLVEFLVHWGLMPDPITGFTGSGELVPENIYLGTTVENQRAADERIPHLLKVPGKRFLSMEPLLGPVNLRNIDAEMAGHQDMYFVDSLTGQHDDMGRPCKDVGKIHAVIVGSESGSHARPAKIEWIESISEQCKKAGVPCFVKQVHINGKLSKNPADWPESIRVRQLPWAEEL